jgi:hypothetical protein
MSGTAPQQHDTHLLLQLIYDRLYSKPITDQNPFYLSISSSILQHYNLLSIVQLLKLLIVANPIIQHEPDVTIISHNSDAVFGSTYGLNMTSTTKPLSRFEMNTNSSSANLNQAHQHHQQQDQLNPKHPNLNHFKQHLSITSPIPINPYLSPPTLFNTANQPPNQQELEVTNRG